MGLSPLGMQPFVRDGNYVVCNGEIYGFRDIKSELEKSGYTFISQSDCEILLPLYEKYGLDMFKKLDAEYACIIYDAKKNDFIAARDPIGIRPLFYGYDQNHNIVFASEAKKPSFHCRTNFSIPSRTLLCRWQIHLLLRHY